MARIRTIKPEFWSDEIVTECSLTSRLLFIGLWNFADDNGNIERSAKQIKMKIFPADNVETEPLIQELLANGLLFEYHNGEHKYLHIKGFLKHQVINKPSKTGHPKPDDSGSTPVVVNDGCGTEGKGKEVGREKEGNIKPLPPESLRLSGALADWILKNNPTHKDLSNGKRDITITRWAADIDKMIRIDGREAGKVEAVINFSQQDPFWLQNILSGATLRKQYDKLVLKIQTTNVAALPLEIKKDLPNRCPKCGCASRMAGEHNDLRECKGCSHRWAAAA